MSDVKNEGPKNPAGSQIALLGDAIVTNLGVPEPDVAQPLRSKYRDTPWRT